MTDERTESGDEPLRDWYLEDGRVVFTAAYHRKRGYCCGNDCRHCPYEQDAVDRGRDAG